MEKKTFRILIDATKETVWQVLWDDRSYPEWTAVFSEGSRAETDWQQGSKVLFVNSEGDGMVAMIAEHRPNEFMSIRHLGEVRNRIEDLNNPKNKEWAGALENYTLNSNGGHTELIVDMDITAEYLDYFSDTWPKALQKVKQMAEQRT